MSLHVRVLYVTALVILMVAGAVLSARTTLPTAAPAACASVPSDVPGLVLPGATAVVPDPSPRPDGDQVVVIVDSSDETLVELRCSRIGTADARRIADTTSQTDEHPEDPRAARRLPIGVDQDPVLVQPRGNGLLAEHADATTGLLRTWFVRGEPTDTVIANVVRRTLEHQEARGPAPDAT